MDRDTLVAYVKRGYSSHKIAKELGKGQTTVRYWLGKYKLRTNFPYRGRRSLPKYCVNCNKELKRWAKKYCSRKCQTIYQWGLKVRGYEDTGIIEGDPFNLKNTRHYLSDKYGHKCSVCGITEWRGQETPLVADHIDGNPYNNKITNLRLVCPNCDAQLPTYKSKNMGHGRKSRKF